MANRSTELIANFVNGFAEGWAFAVPEVFRDALDIKRGRTTVEGEATWTQGKRFSFKEGDTLYTSTQAYSAWDQPWGKTDVILQVQSAKAAGGTSSAKGEWDEGWVRFVVKRQSMGTTKDNGGLLELFCTQRSFVAGLQSGVFVDDYGSTIDVVGWASSNLK